MVSFLLGNLINKLIAHKNHKFIIIIINIVTRCAVTANQATVTAVVSLIF